MQVKIPAVLCVESTVKNSKVGVDYLCNKLMTFCDPRVPEKKLLADQFVAHFLESFFDYLALKTEVFDLKNVRPNNPYKHCVCTMVGTKKLHKKKCPVTIPEGD